MTISPVLSEWMHAISLSLLILVKTLRSSPSLFPSRIFFSISYWYFILTICLNSAGIFSIAVSTLGIVSLKSMPSSKICFGSNFKTLSWCSSNLFSDKLTYGISLGFSTLTLPFFSLQNPSFFLSPCISLSL